MACSSVKSTFWLLLSYRTLPKDLAHKLAHQCSGCTTFVFAKLVAGREHRNVQNKKKVLESTINSTNLVLDTLALPHKDFPEGWESTLALTLLRNDVTANKFTHTCQPCTLHQLKACRAYWVFLPLLSVTYWLSLVSPLSQSLFYHLPTHPWDSQIQNAIFQITVSMMNPNFQEKSRCVDRNRVMTHLLCIWQKSKKWGTCRPASWVKKYIRFPGLANVKLLF